jgi:hypothetical protein
MSEQTATTQHFPCPGCGSRVEYAPGTQTMRCPYCGYEQQIAAADRHVREHSYDQWYAGPRKRIATVGAFVFVCQGCNARTESDKVSDRCQFCGAPLVADTSAGELVVPEVVVPFGLGQPQVRDAFTKWVKSRWFAPTSLRKVGATEQLSGTYLPHWTFDSNTMTYYTGQRGTYYYVTETYTETVDGKPVTRTRQVRHTRWSSVDGTVSRGFDDLLIPATTTLPDKQLQKLAPWELRHGVPYQPAYLSGYRTLRYDVEPDTGLDSAKAIMHSVIEGDCKTDIGGDEQRVANMDTRYAQTMFKLVLLPVWIAAYLHAGRTWQVLVNANTGEVIGDRPYSAGKIVAAVFALVAVLALILFIYQATR